MKSPKISLHKMQEKLPPDGWLSTLITNYSATVIETRTTRNMEETAHGGRKIRRAIHRAESKEADTSGFSDALYNLLGVEPPRKREEREYE